MRPWWRTPFRGFQTNLRAIDPGVLDVEKTLDYIEAYGADTWLLSIGGILANYPSELDSQTVNPALANRASGDMVADAVSAASKRGIRVLGRMDFSKIDARRAERYPHWCFVGPDSEPQIYNGYYSVCPSGEYYQEKMFDVVAEVLSRYGISGFFFNMMHFNEYDYSRRYRGVCQCEACRRSFAEYAPAFELPVGPSSPGYDAWQEFANDTLEILNRRMSDHIRGLSPNAALLLKESADVTYHEANNAVGRPLWHMATAEAVSAARTSDPHRTVYVNCVGFVDMPYRWAGEDPHHFAQYLVQALAHGGNPSTYVMGVPETGDYDCLSIGAEMTRFHRDHVEVYDGLQSAARVGLVRPAGPYGEGDRRLVEFRGWYRLLQEAHFPFDVLRQEALDAKAALRYELLVLPALGPLSVNQTAAAEAVLAHGGAVVATDDSGWRDGLLQIGSHEPLASRLASYTTEQSLFSLHVPVGGGHVPALGGFDVLRPSTNMQGDWFALGRSTYGPPELCYGNEPTPHPSLLTAQIGPGHLAILPWRPGHVHGELGLQRVREGITDMLIGLHDSIGRLRIETDLPPQVQFVLGRNRAGSTVIHLLNRSGDGPQRFLEPLALHGGSFSFASDHEPVGVRGLRTKRDLDWSRAGDRIRVIVPDLHLFEVIEVQLNNG